MWTEMPQKFFREDVNTMKKLKQILTIALVALFALGMIPTTAFAVAETTTVTASTAVKEIPVSKTVTVSKKGTLLPTETFTISMVPATEEDLNPVVEGVVVPATDAAGQTVEVGPALKDSTVTFNFGADDSTNTGSVKQEDVFTLDFDGSFDHTGVYRYYVTENEAFDEDGNKVENGYITYDTTKYIVDLYVAQNSDNSYYVKSYVVTAEDWETKPSGLDFTNAIACANLKIYKNVVGTEYQQGELYTFRILIPVGGTTIDLDEGFELQAKIYDANGPVNDSRSDENGDVWLTVAGANLEADMAECATTFQLKNGEYLEILGAPVTMVYKVEEVTDTEQFQKEGYTVTYDYKEYGKNDTATKADTTDNAGSSLVGTINTDTNEVVFTNTRNIEVPNSGISMDLLPYMLVLVVAAGACVLFVMKKRKAAR
jgi:hypothetical protein